MEILRLENISHKYETKQNYTIRDISFYLKKGECLAIIGESGVGKTTLFQTISGLLCPTSGKILFHGEDITGQPGHVGYMLQKDLLLAHKTIEDNIALPLLIRRSEERTKKRTPDSARVKHIDKTLPNRMDKQTARGIVREHLADFGLADYAKAYPRELSGGMRQRAALLRTYMTGCEITLLDEPFSALDAITKRSMHSWYLSMAKKLELSTIFITHDIDEAIFLADRIVVLRGPVGHIEDILSVPRGSHDTDFQLSPEYASLKRKIFSALRV